METLIKIIVIISLLLQQVPSLHAQNPTQIISQLSSIQANNRPDLVRQLSQQNTGDYSPQDKEELSKILKADSLSYYDKLIRIAGQVGVGEEKLYELSSSSDDINIKTTAKLALARIGDQKILDNLMKNVAELPVDDEFVYRIAPTLIYVRQRETIDYLFDLVLSNEVNCTSPNPDSTAPMICAYRLMEMLAPVVVDFPVSVGKSGDIQTDDYPAALRTVRQWIAQHQGDYELRRDIF
jgi:hypothetical protein